MVVHYEMARRYVGKWVQCHSVLGVHHGFVYKAMREGIILVQHTQLAGYSPSENESPKWQTYTEEGTPEAADLVQFPIGPGLFVPYGGIVGLWPVAPFFI